MPTSDQIVNATTPAILIIVAFMWALEWMSPLVPQLELAPRARHGLRNIGIALCIGLVALGGTKLIFGASMWAEKNQFGVLHWLGPSWGIRFLVSFVGIDFFEYWRHRLHHKVPFLWRLHRVHHTDPHVDTTTSIRGHPLESVGSYIYFAIWIALLGVDPLSLASRTLLSMMALGWHHANFKIPLGIDHVVSFITPTPRTHRLHHSRNILKTDSNFAAVFTIWDRLFGTFTSGNVEPEISTGIDGFDAESVQSVFGVMKSPLKP
jgi:sterol desaturase/sphingolipid hydroxylase (fatty acid hydroxylase superfamily)